MVEVNEGHRRRKRRNVDRQIGGRGQQSKLVLVFDWRLEIGDRRVLVGTRVCVRSAIKDHCLLLYWCIKVGTYIF